MVSRADVASTTLVMSVSPAIDQLAADQRREVLRRLEPAVVGELDEIEVVEDADRW